MFITKRNILRADRFWYFYQFQFYISVVLLAPIIMTIIRIVMKGLEGYYQILLMAIPVLIILFLFYYRRSELRFIKIINDKNINENYLIVEKSINDLNWKARIKSERHIEAFTKGKFGSNWREEMVTIIIYDNLILINCLSNLETSQNTAAFTFGKLTGISKKLKIQIEGYL